MNRIAAIFVSLFALTAQAPGPLFEVPAPTGPLPIGTTRWVITDRSRDETFAPGKKRDIEVIADYLLAKVIGRGPITREECFETLGERVRSCSDYPAAQ